MVLSGPLNNKKRKAWNYRQSCEDHTPIRLIHFFKNIENIFFFLSFLWTTKSQTAIISTFRFYFELIIWISHSATTEDEIMNKLISLLITCIQSDHKLLQKPTVQTLFTLWLLIMLIIIYSKFYCTKENNNKNYEETEI